ncbi:hypothetical protein SDC9_179049 [bioreactor metagenome]|uniref:Uncharacterized protein n=1 Tax=bioreactor metagenome TaxID=1076179 RepID=A0A645GXP3_9ZZZZ
MQQHLQPERLTGMGRLSLKRYHLEHLPQGLLHDGTPAHHGLVELARMHAAHRTGILVHGQRQHGALGTRTAEIAVIEFHCDQCSTGIGLDAYAALHILYGTGHFTAAQVIGMHPLQLGRIEGFCPAVMTAKLHDIAALRVRLQPDVMGRDRMCAEQPGSGRGAQNARDDVFTCPANRHGSSEKS